MAHRSVLPMEAVMWIGSSEGNGWRYEVAQRPDGFLVRAVDLDTGEIDAGAGTLFRTAAVAYAHADTMAALDRFVTADAAEDDVAELRADYAAKSGRLADLCRRLNDEGHSEAALAAWQVAATSAARPIYC